MSRIVSWFSCGAASAVATKLAMKEGPIVIAYCEVLEEHPDNRRFRKDCEEWFDQEIIVLGNDKYERSIYDVFSKTGYLVGPSGARCTKELKKKVREDFQEPGDRQVFGFTAEEQHRVDRFIDQHNEVDIWPILIEHGLTKADCKGILDKSGIEIPEIYKLGYKNANCIGCVKGEAGYWNKIRVDFPDVFKRMSEVENLMNRTVCKIEKVVDGVTVRERVPLSKLPPDQGCYESEESIECGIFCEIAYQEIT